MPNIDAIDVTIEPTCPLNRSISTALVASSAFWFRSGCSVVDAPIFLIARAIGFFLILQLDLLVKLQTNVDIPHKGEHACANIRHIGIYVRHKTGMPRIDA